MKSSAWTLAISNLRGVKYKGPHYESCPYCGKTFIPTGPKNIYCKSECGLAMRRVKLIQHNSKKKFNNK